MLNLEMSPLMCPLTRVEPSQQSPIHDSLYQIQRLPEAVVAWRRVACTIRTSLPSVT